MTARLLTVEDISQLLGCSTRTIHEYTRHNAIPHRVLPRGRRCLFDEAAVRAWMEGADLETIELSHGGRVVRPVDKSKAAA